MTTELMLNLLDGLPDEDQGSEAIYGFDYQIHCVTRLCLEMVHSQTVSETVCEYYEDVTQLIIGKAPRLCQIKKRESVNAWTIPLVKDAIEKLLSKALHRDVSELAIYGNGRPSTDGPCSLAGLIALLDRPASERDAMWESAFLPYEEHFRRLFNEFDAGELARGLRMLRFYLTMPHPQAIKSNNIMLTAEILQQIWGVSVPVPVAQKAYEGLRCAVWDASKQPKQPRSQKCISADKARSLLKRKLEDEKYLAKDTEMVLDTRAKLQKGDLEEYLPYALQQRMDALGVKFALGLRPDEWQDRKDVIAVEWQDFQSHNTGLVGKGLWKELRLFLKRIGQIWASQNNTLPPEFAEELFFDMMAVCEADIGVE
jgi:hypothetical protein